MKAATLRKPHITPLRAVPAASAQSPRKYSRASDFSGGGARRFAVPLLAASAFIVGMFWLLYSLVASTGNAEGNSETLPTVDFIALAKKFEIETKERKPPEMPDRPQPPPEVPLQKVQIQGPTDTKVDINMSLENSTNVKANFGLSNNDGEYLPIVKVAPMYPPRAQSLGLEGWVLLEFTVTSAGTVEDPKVIEAQPKDVFDEAARKAVLKFRYKPRVENGRPVAVPHVQHLIRFELTKK